MNDKKDLRKKGANSVSSTSSSSLDTNKDECKVQQKSVLEEVDALFENITKHKKRKHQIDVKEYEKEEKEKKVICSNICMYKLKATVAVKRTERCPTAFASFQSSVFIHG